MIIGIDLGTTNSLAGFMSPDGPRLIPNALGEFLTPSIVGTLEDGKVVIGKVARELQVISPERCVSTFKRSMGVDWSTKLGKQEFGAIELSSLVLKSLKRDAEAFFGQPVDRAVITVPAYFNEHQRTATIRAGEIAGFQVERILNEPTAAAIAYGFHEAHEEKTLLVFDLGGGTFDVSIIELFEGCLEIKASSGETFLGGEDFTNTLSARILERIGEVFERAELEKPKLVSRLRAECESAKRRLSRETEVTVRIPTADGEFIEPVPQQTVTREEFEKWTAPILGRIDLPLRRALGDAGLQRSDITEVVLVGGATRMAAVVERVRTLFGREPRCSLNPDEVVAMGAAVQAGMIARNQTLTDLVVTDVSPFTLGVEISREFGGSNREGYFLPIINRNTTIPVSRVQRVCTVNPNQRQIQVRVFQGESRMVKDNLLISEFNVEKIPPGPPGQAIDVRFTYDLNGILECEATIVETKRKVTHVVTRFAKGMSKQDIARAVESLQGLKTHPREEEVNRYLLTWADRLYRELPIGERQVLDMLVSGFEAALEQQEKEAIERNREALRAFLGAMDAEGQLGDDDDSD